MILNDGSLIWGTGYGNIFSGSFNFSSKNVDSNVIECAFDNDLFPSLYYIKGDGTLWANDTQIDSNVVSIAGNDYVLYIKDDGTLWMINNNSGVLIADKVNQK